MLEFTAQRDSFLRIVLGFCFLIFYPGEKKMIDWNVVLSSVLQAVLIAVLPPVVVVGLVWLRAQTAWLWAKVREWNPSVADILEEGAEFAVKAAEQAHIGKLVEDRKAYAIEIAEKWLELKGITVDLDLLDAAIEKAVIENFPKPALPTPTE